MRFAQNTQHDTSKVLRLPCKMTSEVSKVLRMPQKLQRIFWKRGKSIVPATQNHFWHVMKHVGIWQSATPAMRNEAMWRWKCPKGPPFAKLTIGTAMTTSRERLRTVANGYRRLSNVWRTQLNPQTPRVKREPLLRIREKCLPASRRHISLSQVSLPWRHVFPFWGLVKLYVKQWLTAESLFL